MDAIGVNWRFGKSLPAWCVQLRQIVGPLPCEVGEARQVTAYAEAAIAAKGVLAIEHRQPRQLNPEPLLGSVDGPGDGDPAPGILRGSRFGHLAVGIGDGTSTDSNNFVPSSSRQNKMADISGRGDQSWNNNHKSMVSVGWYHEDELSGDEYNDFDRAPDLLVAEDS